MRPGAAHARREGSPFSAADAVTQPRKPELSGLSQADVTVGDAQRDEGALIVALNGGASDKERRQAARELLGLSLRGRQSKQFVLRGGIAALKQAVDTFPRDEQLALYSAMAAHNLMSMAQENQERKATEAVELLEVAMGHHPMSAGVQYHGCLALRVIFAGGKTLPTELTVHLILEAATSHVANLELGFAATMVLDSVIRLEHELPAEVRSILAAEDTVGLLSDAVARLPSGSHAHGKTRACQSRLNRLVVQPDEG